MSQKYNSNNIGLYHDDGYQFLETLVDKKKENKKNNKGLQSNLTIVHYFDVTLNLNDGIYHHFHKLNDKTIYIHVESTIHPKLSRKS